MLEARGSDRAGAVAPPSRRLRGSDTPPMIPPPPPADASRPQKPFGARSPSGAVSGDDASWRDLLGRDRSPPAQPAAAPSRRLLSRTVKLCLATALVGFGATHFLARAIEGGGLVAAWREARAVSVTADPETTGSIGAAARGARLDPCQSPAALKPTR